MAGKQGWSRRDFLKASSAAAVAAGIGMSVGSAEAQSPARDVSPNDKIVLGVIGLGGRGIGVMDGFRRYPEVEIGAICDVYDERLKRAYAKTNLKPSLHRDYREILDRKDIDAVIVATPPHWHPLITIHACQAGKDVYCEKPISRFAAEAIAMAKAARDNKRVTQVGTQIHAGDNFRRAVEIVRSGILGKIMAVRVLFTANEYPGGIGSAPDSDPPDGLDWDMWLGPAPAVPFNDKRFGTHRYFTDYVPSWLSELGPHIIDLAFWALDLGQPLAVSASGGRFIADDMGDIPDTLDVLWEYPGMTLTWMHTLGNSYNFDFGGPPDRGRRLGVIFHGQNGTLLADYGTHKVVPEGDALDDVAMPGPSIPSSPGHDREFLDAIKSREQPPCSLDYHLPIALSIDLAHISLKVGRKLHWDEKKGEIAGDREANSLMKPVYRKPWAFPKV